MVTSHPSDQIWEARTEDVSTGLHDFESSAQHIESGRVLIAEDDMEFSKLLQQVLRLQGHIVKAEFSAKSAWERLEHEHFDLVVLDFVLPGFMLGKDPFEGLKLPFGSRPSVVYVGAHPRGSQFIPRSSQAPSVYLRKPFSLPLFLEATTELLAARRFQRRNTLFTPENNDLIAGEPHAAVRDVAQNLANDAELDSVEVKFASMRHFLKEYGSNIAHGGLFVHTDKNLTVGQPVKLVVELPSQDAEQRVVVRGEVAYVRGATDGEPAGVGVNLVGLEDTVRRAFQAAVVEAHSLDRLGRPARIALFGAKDSIDVNTVSPVGKTLEFLSCSTLDELLELARKDVPDVLILQLKAVDEAVLRTLAVLKSTSDTSHIPILALGPISDREKALAGGLDAYFEFPHGARELMRTALSILQDPRRAHVRVRFRQEVQMRAEGWVSLVEGVDLSEGGICVQAPLRVQPAQDVILSVTLPDLDTPFEIPAEVVWCQDSLKGRGSRIGLVYKNVDLNTRNRLRCYIFYALQTQSNEILERTADLFEHVQRRQMRVPYNESVVLRLGEAAVYAEGVDISTGGVGIVSPVRFDEELTVTLELLLPTTREVERLRAVVVASHSTVGQQWRTGFMFVDAPEDALGRIENFVLSWRNLS